MFTTCNFFQFGLPSLTGEGEIHAVLTSGSIEVGWDNLQNNQLIRTLAPCGGGGDEGYLVSHISPKYKTPLAQAEPGGTFTPMQPFVSFVLCHVSSMKRRVSLVPL